MVAVHSSSADIYQVGINSNGSNILVHDCKLVGFYGQAISANGGRVSAQGNMFWNGAVFVAGAGNGSIISGNFVTRPAILTPGLRGEGANDAHPALISLVGHGIVVSGNNIRDDGPAGDILDLGDSQSVMVSGNSFSTADEISGGNNTAQARCAITAHNTSSSSGFITGNLFVNRNALSPAASAGSGGLIATNNWVAGRLLNSSEPAVAGRSRD